MQFPSLKFSTPQVLLAPKPNFLPDASLWPMLFNKTELPLNLQKIQNPEHRQRDPTHSQLTAPEDIGNTRDQSLPQNLSGMPFNRMNDIKELLKFFQDLHKIPAEIHNNYTANKEKMTQKEQCSKTVLKKSKKIKKHKSPEKDPELTKKGDKAKKTLWSTEEDTELLELYNTLGPRWADIAKAIKKRTRKQVRDRYLNYVKPGINHGEWTEEEDRSFARLYRNLGKKWCEIAAYLPGRTENQVKNRYYWAKKDHYWDFLETSIKQEHSLTEIKESSNFKNKSDELRELKLEEINLKTECQECDFGRQSSIKAENMDAMTDNITVKMECVEHPGDYLNLDSHNKSRAFYENKKFEQKNAETTYRTDSNQYNQQNGFKMGIKMEDFKISQKIEVKNEEISEINERFVRDSPWSEPSTDLDILCKTKTENNSDECKDLKELNYLKQEFYQL